MPELPEVETVVRDLRPHLGGRTVTGLRAGRQRLRRPWSRAWESDLVGQRFGEAARRGKWIVLPLVSGPRLLIHLGMTGQLTVADAAAPVLDHTHLVFALDGGRELRFRDIRRFGSVTLLSGQEELERFFAKSGLGPEPFGLDRRAWRAELASTRRCLKAVLLDQRVVAGVGNIYADESLFEAGLHPGRAANALTAAQAEHLRRAVETVLTRAIDCRGSSIRNYVGGSGLRGGYQEQFRVYGRTGEPCPRCGTAIERQRLAGRSTHYCPRCQRQRRSPARLGPSVVC